MDQRAKRNAAILLLVGLAAAIVLSSSLSRLQLKPGSPFPGASNQAEAASGAPPRTMPAGSAVPVFQGLLATVVLGLFFYLLIRLLTFSNIKKLFMVMLALAAILVLLIALPRLPSGRKVSLPPESAARPSESQDYTTSPLGRPPPAFIWIAGIVGVAGVALAGAAALRRRAGAAPVQQQLRQEAELAVEAIEAGSDWTEVVVRCYLQMIRLIHLERSMEREPNMTVREFEAALEPLGLPAEPLWRLRTLFEAVRYGNRTLNKMEEQTARDSLQAIVDSLRGGRP